VPAMTAVVLGATAGVKVMPAGSVPALIDQV
jgi:hypothetical protein